MKYAFIATHKERHGVALLCRILGVSHQGYYKWCSGAQQRQERTLRDERLLKMIRAIHQVSKGRYGSPRIHQKLKEMGVVCSEKRVAQLMKDNDIRAKGARKFKATTNSKHSLPVAPNLLERDFVADKPNEKWVSDITYLWTDEGWMYLAVFIDLFSRKVVGWALSNHMRASLVILAFERAMARRRPPSGLLVHSDRGAQYESQQFRQALHSAGAKQSMSDVGDCYDNAVAESFFHSMKVEAIHGERFEFRRTLEIEVFDYIERFYNKVRRHSTIGKRSPDKFEDEMRIKLAA